MVRGVVRMAWRAEKRPPPPEEVKVEVGVEVMSKYGLDKIEHKMCFFFWLDRYQNDTAPS